MSDTKRRLVTIRASGSYGCVVRPDAAIIVDEAQGVPFMQVGDDLFPLSAQYGGILQGSQLEADIHAALA